jgi:predicted Zn-dependent peptidase
LNWDDVAFDIGHYAIMDRWQTLFREMDALQEVTDEELQAIAKKYLVKTNRIVGVATREPAR